MNATTEEILEAFQGLTDDESAALRNFASKLLRARRDWPETYSGPIDLIHEALYRSLEGRRNWPTNLAFTLHMVQTIRSIVGHDCKRDLKRRKRLEAMAVSPELGAAARWSSLDEQAMFFEQIELALAALTCAKAGLAEDEIALKVLDGMLAGLSPRETCAHYDISAKDFDSARHRATRYLRGYALAQKNTGSRHMERTNSEIA